MKKSQNTEGKKKKRRARILPLYMQKKLSIALAVFMLSFLGLTIVLYNLVRANNEEYNKIVLSQRQATYDSRTLPFRRGDIMDRNGTILATSQKVYNLILDPKLICSREDGRYIDATVEALSAYFGYDAEELRKLLQEKFQKSYVKYQKQLSYEEKAGFEQYQSDQNAAYAKAGAKERVKGVWFEEEYRRYYPYKSMGCNIIGFSNADGSNGTGGVEQYYNDTLMGVNGREYGYMDEETKLQSVIREPLDGESLVTTLNTNIQNAVEKYLNQWQNEDIGSQVAAAIVMDPKTGEVLAMASTNQFDLNNPRELDSAEYPESVLMELGTKEAVGVYKREHEDSEPITEAEVPEYYTEEEVLSYGRQVAWNQIWRNVVISDTYEPGSTAKLFTIAGALEEAAIGEDTTFNCDGGVSLNDGVNNWVIRCNKRDGHGTLDTEHAIMMSCNVFLMDTAFAEGADTFVKYMDIFGLGKKTGIDLPAEADTSDLVYTADKLGRTTLATNSFGQNYNVTMIQIASAYCSILNGGSYYKPHVVKQILNQNGIVVKDVKPELIRTTVSKSTCDFLKEALFATVEEGTGKLAQIQGYHVGGKTGTAQKLPRAAKNYLVSFCGFAPVEDPQVLVYVIVDTPNLPGEEQASASFATKIEQKIMNEALQFLNISPQGETDPENSINHSLHDSPEGFGQESLGSQVPMDGEEEGEDGADTSSAQSGETAVSVRSVAVTDERVEGDGGDDAFPEAVPETKIEEETEGGG